MNFILIIIVSVVIISIIVLAIFREYIKNKSNNLSQTISTIPPYFEKNRCDQQFSTNQYYDIPSDLNHSFENEYISNNQKHDFINYYTPYYQEIYPILHKCNYYKIALSETVSKFCNDYESINELVNEHNNKVISI